MAKFCGNCGAQMEDDARVCGNCGTSFASTASPVNTATNFVPGTGDAGATLPKKKNKTVGLIFAAIVMIVVVVISLNVLSMFTGYKGTVRKLFNALEGYDMDTLSTLVCDFVYDYHYNLLNVDETKLDDAFEKAVSDTLDQFEDAVGNNAKISYSINDAAKLSDRKLEQFLAMVEDSFDYDSNNIKTVMSVDITITVKGSKKSTTYNIHSGDLLLVKEDNAWKVYYPNFNIMQY